MIGIMISAIAGYLIGSISNSVILTKLIYKKDVRDFGSGNAGATNVLRVFGTKMGALTFLLDALKCAIAMWIGKSIGGEIGFAVAGITCLIGHCYPVFFGLRGGKAVACSFGAAAMIDYRLLIIAVAVFALVYVITKTISISSIAASFAMMVWILFKADSVILKVLGVMFFIMIAVMHRDNIKRIIKHEEPKTTY